MYTIPELSCRSPASALPVCLAAVEKRGLKRSTSYFSLVLVNILFLSIVTLLPFSCAVFYTDFTPRHLPICELAVTT